MIRPAATGQTRCFGADGREIACPGSGQDAETRAGRPWPEPRFEVVEAPADDAGPEAVRDRLTGLEWTRDAAPFTFPLSWPEAARACAELNGASGPGPAPERVWRLPNRRELFSLVSFARANPALPEGHPFRNAPSLACWTSTRAARNPAYRWYVQLSGGRMFYHREDSPAMVWPVRGASAVLPVTGRDDEPATGAAWPAPRFEIAAAHPAGEDSERTNGSVRDRLTGLLWTRNANLGEGRDRACLWAEALERIADLNRASGPGRPVWRLPDIRELESLVDAARHDPALPEGHPFTDGQEAYWSSTSSAYEPDWAMCLYLHKGAVGVGYKPGPERFSVWACADAPE